MGRFEEDKKSVVAILFHFKQSTQYSLYIRQLPRILEARQALIDISRRRVEATRKPSGLEGGWRSRPFHQRNARPWPSRVWRDVQPAR